MTSRSKTILNFTALLIISILWILLINKYITIPFILIIFSLRTFYRIWKTQKDLLGVFDSAESITNFQSNTAISNKFGEFRYTIKENLLNLEKQISRNKFKPIIKIDKSKNKLIHYNQSTKKIKLSELDYIAIMITRTLKTNRNIIQISYKYKGRLHELLFYICPPKMDFNNIKSYFIEFVGQLGAQTSVKIKIIER